MTAFGLTFARGHRGPAWQDYLRAPQFSNVPLLIKLWLLKSLFFEVPRQRTCKAPTPADRTCRSRKQVVRAGCAREGYLRQRLVLRRILLFQDKAAPYLSCEDPDNKHLGRRESDSGTGELTTPPPLTSPTMCFPLMNASKPHTAALSSKGKTYFASMGT